MTNVVLPRNKRGRPIIRTTHDVLDYWGERIRRTITFVDGIESVTRSSVIMRGDTIYHYGTHFPLATIIRHDNGRARLVLLNGDEWRGGTGYGMGTAQRQSQARNVVQREIEGTRIQSMVVPFSALDAADVDRQSIRILDQADERYEVKHYTSDERPGKPVKVDDPSGATYPHDEIRYGYVNAAGEVFQGNAWEVPEGYAHRPYTHVVERPVKVDHPTRANVDESRIPRHEWFEHDCELQSDGKWHWTTRRHWLGDALFTAITRTHKDERADDGRLLSSELVERRAKFLSSFDYQEPRPLYFLCELPRTSAKTIPDALEALKPKTVVDALASGLDVLRQGDVFAIPTSLTTNELKSRAKVGSETVMVPKPCGECDLCRDNTPNWCVNQRYVTEERPIVIRSRQKHGAPADVLNTNHRPTHLIVTEDGDYYGRGFMYHDPSGWGRTPDHARLKLGDGQTWYRLVKNTVPKDLGRGIVTGTARRSGSNRAWTIGGSVD